nr:hypothetical protein [Tanacetum cinerariifolium]
EVILFYNRLDVLTRQILNSKGVIPSKTAADAKVAIQEMAEFSQKWHNGTSSKSRSAKTSNRLVAIQAQLNNLRREIKKVNEKVYAAQVGCELCKGPQYTKDCPQKKEGKTLEEAYYTQFSAPYQPGGQYRAARPRFYQRNNGKSSIGKFVFPIDFIILDIPEDDDVPLILERPFLSTAHSKIDVFIRKITLRVEEEKLVFKSIKLATSIIKRVFMLKNLDSKTELIGESDESFNQMYGFTIIDGDDETKGVVLGMPFCKYLLCQMIMNKFTHGDECE